MENIEQPTEELNGAQLGLEEGSMLGKFKDATSLLDAYNNLQAEFTRKSQKLAEVSKKADGLSEKLNALTKHQTNESPDLLQPDSTEKKELHPLDDEIKECSKQEDVKKDDALKSISENSPCEENIADFDNFDAELSKKLLQFAENKPQALNDLSELKQEIMQNQKLLKLENGVDIAYRLVKEKQKCEPAELVSNPNFIEEYILPNQDITNMIVDKYVKSLANKSAIPKLISGDSQTMVYTPNATPPKTLKDANKIFEKMLEK